nr:14958_t:CDS:2 [Entrophospora candida]
MTSVLNSEDNDIENSNSNNQNQSTPPVSPTSTSPSVSTSNTLLLCSSNNDNKRETITLPSSFKFIKKHGKICIYDSETKISKPDQVNYKNHKDEKDIDNGELVMEENYLFYIKPPKISKPTIKIFYNDGDNNNKRDSNNKGDNSELATSIWVAKTDNLNICNDNYHTNLVHDYHINPCATWHLNSISNDKIKSKFDKDLVIKHQSQEKNSDELEDEEFDNNNEVRVEEDIYCTVEDIGENSNSTIFNVKSDTLKVNSHYIKKYCNNFNENECITFLLTTGLIAKNSFHKLMQEKKESEATRKEHEQDLQYGMGIWDGRLEYKNQLVKIYG